MSETTTDENVVEQGTEKQEQVDKEQIKVEEFFIFDYVGEELVKPISKAKNVKLHINSFGGDFFAGLALSSILQRKNSIAFIEGIAGSAATLVASAAKLTYMYRNGFYVIHNPFSFAVGDYRELKFISDVLETLADGAAQTYSSLAEKKGVVISKEEFRKLMDEERWFTAEEAYSYGLIDGMIDEEAEFKVSNSILKFKKTPEFLLEKYYKSVREKFLKV